MASRCGGNRWACEVTWWGTYPVDPRYHLFMKEILENLGKFGVGTEGGYIPFRGLVWIFLNLRDWLWLKVKDSLLLKLKTLDDFVWCLWLCNDTINLLNSNPREVVCTHTHTRSPFLQLQMRTNWIFKWYQLSLCFCWSLLVGDIVFHVCLGKFLGRRNGGWTVRESTQNALNWGLGFIGICPDFFYGCVQTY